MQCLLGFLDDVIFELEVVVGIVDLKQVKGVLIRKIKIVFLDCICEEYV